MSISIIKQTSVSNTTLLWGRAHMYIVVHYTAGSSSRTGTARNTALMFSNPNVCASADFIVDDEQIVQFNPDLDNRFTWHCGDNRSYTKGGSCYGRCTNANSIGIEVCSTNPNWSASTPANSPNWSYTDAAISKTVELVQHLMQVYNIPVDRVIRHYDVSGKLCPGIIGWNADSGDESKWKAFKARLVGSPITITKPAKTDVVLYRVRKSWDNVKSQIGAFKSLDGAKALVDKNKGYYAFDGKGNVIYPKPTGSVDKGYVVSINTAVLNVRNGPGVSYKINTAVKQGERYTIVSEKNGWGKLLSGAGWICLAYTKKV